MCSRIFQNGYNRINFSKIIVKMKETNITPKPKYHIQWEPLPDNFTLPENAVEDIYHHLLASALREMLELGGFIQPNMLITSHLGIAAIVNEKVAIESPDWCYIPSVFSDNLSVFDRGYIPHVDGDIPAIVIEFISERDRGEYSSNSIYPYGKWFFYERVLKVPIYIIFDPYLGNMEVYQLKYQQYEFQERDREGRYWLDSMNLFIGVWQGKKGENTGNWLRFWDASGKLLPWSNEQIEASYQQGVKQGKFDLIMHLLRRKGELKSELKAKFQELSSEDLDMLAEELLEFSPAWDFSQWLEITK